MQKRIKCVVEVSGPRRPWPSWHSWLNVGDDSVQLRNVGNKVVVVPMICNIYIDYVDHDIPPHI